MLGIAITMHCDDVQGSSTAGIATGPWVLIIVTRYTPLNTPWYWYSQVRGALQGARDRQEGKHI